MSDIDVGERIHISLEHRNDIPLCARVNLVRNSHNQFCRSFVDILWIEYILIRAIREASVSRDIVEYHLVTLSVLPLMLISPSFLVSFALVFCKFVLLGYNFYSRHLFP